MLAADRWHSQPSGDQHAQNMSMRKQDNVALGLMYPLYHPIRPNANLVRRFSARTSIPEDLPVGNEFPDLAGRQAFVLAVSPLSEIGLDGGRVSEARQIACLASPPQGANEYKRILPARKHWPHPLCQAPTVVCQRDVRRAGVLAAQAPCGLPVADREHVPVRLNRPSSRDPGSALASGPSWCIVYSSPPCSSLDAFAGGFVVQASPALWLFERFDLSLSAASLFFFWSGVLSAFSFPVAAWISRRVGLINTMVFTHMPSSLCLILAAFAPTLTLAMALLLVRAALSQMDVPTRSSYVMAVVTDAERPAAASFTSVPRSLAAAASPAIAGALFAASFQFCRC